MFGLSATHTGQPEGTSPVLVHTVQSDQAWELVQKIWQANHRSVVQDMPNRKELIRFAFSNPTCVSWVQHDQGRTDTFELILVWGDDKALTEVYAIQPAHNTPTGDDVRLCSLLAGILASPATVPAVH